MLCYLSCSYFSAEKYVGEKIQDLETKVAAGEKITEESFVAYLVREGKLSHEEILSSLAEMFGAAIDTVGLTLDVSF